MAEAPAGPSKKGDLEQKIMQALQGAGRPMKTAELVKRCQVPKKELNQVLYRMKTVALAGPATWCLAGDKTGDVVPSEPAERGPSFDNRPSEEAALKPPQNAAVIPQSPGSPLSEQQKAIYQLLAVDGPRAALSIAQALGMKTAKDVNPDLYTMRNKHLLSLDQNSKSWAIYQPDDSGRKNQYFENIYPQKAVNVIFQTRISSHVSIANSRDIQIGHVNIMKCGDSGSAAPPGPPPTAPSGPSMQEAPDSTWAPRDIHVTHCKQVQLGYHNKMTVYSALDQSPTDTPPGSPSVFDTPNPEASSEAQEPKLGSQDKGEEVQNIHIRECQIGTSDKTTISSATPEGDNREDPEEQEKDEDAGSKRADSEFPRDFGQAATLTTLTATTEALTLGSRDPTPAEDRDPGKGNEWEVGQEPAATSGLDLVRELCP